jgi:uncharacterized Tic20 family protein
MEPPPTRPAGGPPTPPAPSPSEPPRQSRELVTLALAGLFLGLAIVPAVVRWDCRDDPLVRHYATEALNLQLGLALTMAGPFVALVVGSDALSLAGYLLYGTAFVYALIASFMAEHHARKGRCWSLPVNLRLFRP